MKEMNTSDNISVDTKQKKHASFLKLSIKSDDFKMNLIPIPLWFAKISMSFVLNVGKFFLKNKLKEKDLSKQDINEMIDAIKLMMKELRNLPPFTIVEVEDNDTHIIIKTT